MAWPLAIAGTGSKLISLAFGPVGRYVTLSIVVIGALWLYGNHRYNEGASDKDAEYQQIIEKERTRLREANRQALEEAQRKVDELERTLEARDAQLEDITREANEDPDGGRESLGVNSLRRLNRID